MRKHSGKGTIHYLKGEVYEGEFKDAEPHGEGKMTYEDGRVREGTWKDGQDARQGDFKVLQWKRGL